MAQTSGDQTKDGNQTSSGSKSDAPNPSAAAAAAAAATTTSSTTTATTTSTGTSVNDHEQDKDFELSAEAMIDDIDDERTLEEEEALASADAAAVQNEIDDLKRESEMPIEELLAFYERMRNEEAAAASAGQGEEDEDFEDGEEDDDDEEDEEDEDDEEEEEDGSDEHSHPEQPAERSTQQQMQPQQVSAHLSNPQTILSPQQQQQSDVSLNNNSAQLAPQSVADISGRQSQNQHQDSTSAGFGNNAPSPIHPTSLDKSQAIDGYQQRQHSHGADHHHHHHNLSHSHHYHHQYPQQSLDLVNTVSSTTPRTSHHRHSITEFLVDSDTAASGFLQSLLNYDLSDSDDLDEDYSYTDDENAEEEREWRRIIHVGPEHQADIPDGLAEYENDLPPYENEDTLVWRCNPEQDQEQILDYLKRASMIPRRNDISISPASVPKISEQNVRLYRERMHVSNSAAASLNPMEQNHENINIISENPPENLQDVYMSQSRKRLRIDSELEQENAMDGLIQPSGDMHIVNNIVSVAKDDNSNSVSQDNRPGLSTEDYFQGEEQLLYLLLQCNYNYEEALRRRRLDPFKYYISEPMSLWSQEECLGFEHGLRAYGKNFRLIRDLKVQTRTRAEVVAFYYLWKKSERHDVYTNQYKIDRKRSLNHPGTTDYMDKFIEDNESALNASSTPTPTPTESTVDVHQISHIPNLVGNQAMSLCNSSTPAMASAECFRIPQELSMVQAACNEPIEHQTVGEEAAKSNSF